MNKPILCLDFDGVIHSYTSGWKGARIILDPPVPGALDFILAAQAQFTVAILSSRSHQWGGRRAMKQWMREHVARRMRQYDLLPTDPFVEMALENGAHTYEQWHDVCTDAARDFVKSIRWPIFKPPAMITLDDRALNFTGEWPTIDALDSFKPWYHK